MIWKVGNGSAQTTGPDEMIPCMTATTHPSSFFIWYLLHAFENFSTVTEKKRESVSYRP
jgi:hypothetical protein